MIYLCRLCSVFGFLFVAWLPSSAFAQKSIATVRVATMPVTNFTPLLVAIDKGYFGEEKLNVSVTTVSQGALAIEAVYGGSAEFGASGILEPMIARGNGLDISFVAPTAKIRSTPPDHSVVLVRANDNIRTASDLVGKTISAGLVNSINYVHMHEWLQKRGVDPQSVHFIEIPFPQTADALFQKRVDAVWTVEPFVTYMLRSGKAHLIASPYQDNIPGMDITAFVAKESWLAANPDVASRFKRAIDRATVFLQRASKEERDEWVAKFTGVKPDVVSAMNLPEFSAEFNVPSLLRNLEIAVQQKAVKPFDVDRMMWRP